MESTIEIVIKTVLLFLFTLFCFRLMGYRSLGDMEPMDYVIVLGIGEILGAPLAGEKIPIWKAVLAIATLTSLQILFSYIYAKSAKLNKYLDGKPIPVIRDGRLLQSNLLRHRISKEDILEELRIKGLRDERDVSLANLEPSGRFSVILKNEATPVTPRYLGREISYNLAVGGKIDPQQWEKSGVSIEEVADFLESRNITHWDEVDNLLLKNGQFIVERKEKAPGEED